MAACRRARPVVTTHGRLTEAAWQASGAVALAGVTMPAGVAEAVVRLLADAGAARSSACAAGNSIVETFSVERVVKILRAADVRAA